MRSIDVVTISCLGILVACGGEPFQVPEPANMVDATTSSSDDGGGGAVTTSGSGGEGGGETTGTTSSTKSQTTTTTTTPTKGTSSSGTSGTVTTTTLTGEGAGGSGGGETGGGGNTGTSSSATTTETTNTTSVEPTCQSGKKLCGDWCVEINDPTHGCGIKGCEPCSLPHAASTCAGTSCAVSSCDADFGDCDGDDADGCETDLGSNSNCGACGKTCGQLEQCQSGVCVPTGCPAGLGNCDGNQANGCETDLVKDVNNCGVCGNVCKLAHATPTCSVSECAIASCDVGFDDCDSLDATGCEKPVSSDVKHCGSCGHACSFPNAASVCNAGACGLGACNALWGDCDGTPGNGCEKSLAADAANCGACGKSCGAQGNACEVGKCFIPCGTFKIAVGEPAVCFTLNANKQPPGTQPAVGGIIPPNAVQIPWEGCTSPGTGGTFGCTLKGVVGSVQIKATFKAIQGATKFSMCGQWGAGSTPLCNADVVRFYNADGTLAHECTGTKQGEGASLQFCSYASEGGETFIVASVK